MIRYLFYPGVILHEFAHLITCIFLNVKVSKLKFGLKESYVKHNSTGPIRMSLIALAPFYFGFVVSYLIILFSKNLGFLYFLFFNYLAFAFLYNSIPSIQDIKNIVSAIKESIQKDWKSFSRKLLLLLKILNICQYMFVQNLDYLTNMNSKDNLCYISIYIGVCGLKQSFKP